MPSLNLQKSSPDYVSIFILASVLAIIALTFRDYGVSWDEPIQATYGNRIIDFYLSGFKDLSALNLANLRFYGGLFEVIAQSLSKVSPFYVHETRHALNALVGWFGLLGVWRFGRYLGGPAAGLIALVLIATFPSFYGHMFINSKDIPFAVGYIWTLYYMVRTFDLGALAPVKQAIGLGIFLGLTLGIRVGGVVLLGYFGLLMLLLVAAEAKAAGNGLSGLPSVIKGKLSWLAKSVLCIAIPAYVIMVAAWPWALLNPLKAVFVSLAETSAFKWEGTVLFMGDYVPAVDLPASYIPVYLGVKLPEMFVVLLLVTLPFALQRTVRAYRSNERTILIGYAALWLGAFFPVLYAIVFKTVHYDGIRHFLFIAPPLAVLVATEVVRHLPGLIERYRLPVMALSSALLISVLHTVWTMGKLHPYQYVYYNAASGGLAGAEGRYELDYWGLSYKEAISGLVAHVLQELDKAPPSSYQKRYAVAVCGPHETARIYLPVAFQVVPMNQLRNSDYFLSFRRWGCDEQVIAPIVSMAERDGVVLSVVKKLR